MKKEFKTKKEIAVEELKEEIYNVLINGEFKKMTIPQLNKMLGLPKAVMVFNRMEARTGQTVNPFITVERFADGQLRYDNGTVIKGIKRSILPLLDYSGIKTAYRRKENYDPEKMPKATMGEIDADMRKNLKEKHDGAN